MNDGREEEDWMKGRRRRKIGRGEEEKIEEYSIR